MKICKIYIKGFQQFQDVELDFTHPETGEPLDKICFIGSNGTGKSTALRLIERIIDYTNFHLLSVNKSFILADTVVKEMVFELKLDTKIISVLIFPNHVREYLIFNQEILSFDNIVTGIRDANKIPIHFFNFSMSENEIYELYHELEFKNNAKDLLIYSPAESTGNGYYSIKDVPNTTVNEALNFSKSFPFYALVASDTVNTFWKILVYNLRKRAEEREAYENIPANLIKTKAQLIKEFDEISPKILDSLNEVWDKILSKAGLYFDVKGANNPFQLSDNLKAYIKLKGLDKTIPYNEISTGIRNFIFRVGHIFSLYFNREIDRAFLLIDEPENSLFPDFLFDLVEIYNQVILDKRGQNNTQMFFATHNPIIAAQFRPYERIILAWEEDGTVKTYRGEAPEGDDPNDILKKDFGVRELMGQKGTEEWKKYLDLKSQLKKADAIDKKMALAAEINEVGRLYNFPA